MNKKVSIIMGIYNCANTLGQAIDAILAQTYTNWELIMCNDGSKDNTAVVAEEYVNKYPNKIKLIHNDKNRGLNYTLNHCLQEVSGEYVARMDGDDVCSKERLEKEINYLETHPEIALVSCNMELYDEEGVFGVVKYKEEPVLKDFLKTSQFCHAGCMIRTKVIKELGGYSESDKFLRVEDYELWVRLYLAGYKGYNLQEVLYSMRDDRNAVGRRTLKNRKNESRVIMKVCKEGKFPFYLRFYALKPIIKWFVPSFFLKRLHKNKHAK